MATVEDWKRLELGSLVRIFGEVRCGTMKCPIQWHFAKVYELTSEQAKIWPLHSTPIETHRFTEDGRRTTAEPKLMLPGTSQNMVGIDLAAFPSGEVHASQEKLKQWHMFTFDFSKEDIEMSVHWEIWDGLPVKI